MKVTIYGKKWCSYCDRAKDLLKDRGVEYSFYDIQEDDEALKEFKARIPGSATVPQIFLDEAHVGGYDDLRSYFKKVDASASS